MLKLWKLWWSRKRLALLAYLVIGLVVADSHRDLAHIRTVEAVLSAILAVGLWPLVVFGMNLNVR